MGSSGWWGEVPESQAFFWKLQAYIIAIDCVVRFRCICVVKFTGSVEKKEL